MSKVVKCFDCKEYIHYDEIYDNGTSKFLLDKDKRFVGYYENGDILCPYCFG